MSQDMKMTQLTSLHLDTTGDGISNDHKYLSDETWIQNTFKSEYRRSFDRVAMMVGVDLARNEQDGKRTARFDIPGSWGSAGVATGELISSSTNEEDINAIYAEVQAQLTDNLTSTINYRYDNLKYDYVNDLDNTLNTAPSYNANSYRIGFNYKINDAHNMYTSYATGFRAPTAQQISGNIENLQADPTLDIQTDLDMETTSNIELGIRGNIASLKYDASIYQLDRKNYIGIRAGSYLWSSDDDADMSVGNMGDMRSRGFELAINSNRAEMVSFSLAYTYLDAKFKQYSINPNDGGQPPISLDGNTVPRTSKHTVNLIVDVKPIKNLLISTEFTAKSSYFADEANKYEQPGYGVVNINADYKVGKGFELFGKIENLLDKVYNQFVNVGYGNDMEDATIRVAPSRAFYAGLRYRF